MFKRFRCVPILILVASLLLIAIPSVRLFSQDLGFRLDFSLPSGDSSQLFSPSPGLETYYTLPLLPSGLLRASALVGYRFQPVEFVEENFSLVNAGLSFDASYPLLRTLQAGLALEGGMYTGLIGGVGATAASTWAGVTGSITLGFFPRLPVDLRAGWRRYWNMMDSFSLSAGMRIVPPKTAAKRAKQLKPLIALERDMGRVSLVSSSLQPVFPIFYGWYDKNPFGSMLIRNEGAAAIEKLTISFDARQYMDTPRVIELPGALEPGETAEIPIYAVFSKRILEESEGAKIAATITFQFETQGSRRSSTASQTMTVLNRNALTWDDDRKAAAFVTAKDSVIMEFARSAAQAVPAAIGLDRNLVMAAAVYEALRTYGLSYVVDPASSYAAISTGGGGTVDYLQFPRQTLQFRSGDCDDLSVLYCGLLEAVGVESAFIMTPGHILAAVPTSDANERSARAEGREWIPVELTMTKSDFAAARKKGMELWESGDEVRLVPVREAWKEYPPVAFTEAAHLDLPSQDKLVATIGTAIDLLARKKLEQRLAGLDLASRDVRVQNRIGITYAHFGRYKEARRAFDKAIVQGDFVPALVNIGHLAMIEGDAKTALAWYERAAAAASPASVAALMGKVNALAALGDRPGAEVAAAALAARDPTRASKLSQVALSAAGGARGADESGLSTEMSWEDE